MTTLSNWHWSFFTPKEIACKGKACCGGELWDKEEYGEKNIPYYLVEALDKLEMLRTKWGKPIILNSAHRCKKHNKRIGGALKSQHLKIAFDCRIKKEEQEKFILLAKECGFTGIGKYKNFVHLDCAKKRDWQGNY